MTIIVATAGMMLADAAVSLGQLQHTVAFPKIVRLPDGGLLGAAGLACDCYSVQQWFLAGEPEKRPKLLGIEPDGGVDFLLMRPDGSVWRNISGVDGLYPQPDPASVGSHEAAVVVDTAIRCGKSPVEAVELVIKMLSGFGGPVQVETLSPTRRLGKPGDIMEIPDGWPPNASRAGSRFQAWGDYWRANHGSQPNGVASDG